MIQIGAPSPSFRLPALVDGQLALVDLAHFRTQWVVLCFVPRLELLEAVFLDRHVDAFHREGVSFLAVSPGQDPLHEGWINQFGSLRVPIVADPLRRLHRRYRINATETPPRCQTFFIDPDGLFRFHLVHDLNGRGMSALLEILPANRTQDTQRSTAGHLETGHAQDRTHVPAGIGASEGRAVERQPRINVRHTIRRTPWNHSIIIESFITRERQS
jgi:alkyl hydroperoxide reductase subunit AhpC